MSTKSWEVKKFTRSTLERVDSDLRFVLKHSQDVTLVAMFIGFKTERDRQARIIRVERYWESALRSRHRYARGINRVNYYNAGVVLIGQLASLKYDLKEETPTMLVLDKIMEKMYEEESTI